MNFNVTSPTGTEDFQQYFSLRWEILRRPWNQPSGSERDDNEEDAFHFAVKDDNGNIRAVCRLQDNTAGVGQIRYMAVETAFQGMGLGKMLLISAEEKAKQEGMSTIILQARENAVNFYKSQGYHIVEKTFLLFDSIQHYLMKKDLK